MGAGLNKAVQPEELTVFKKLSPNTQVDNIQIPERAENRVPTDRKFLIAFILVVLILFPFLIYSFVYADWGRFKGYDPCGNVCGQKNSKYSQWSCSGKDETDKPYLQYDEVVHENWLLTPRQCVANCGYGSVGIMGRCVKNDYSRSRDRRDVVTKKTSESLSDFMNKMTWRIVLACALSLVVGIGMLILFKTATAVVVWGIIGGVLVFCAIVSGLLWYFYVGLKKSVKHSDIKDNASQSYLLFAIFFTVFTLILFCMTVFMFRKIQLVIQMLKEATKAAFAMPLLIFVPIITFLSELFILILLIVTTSLILTSGVLTEIIPGYLYYNYNVVMSITFFFNLIVAFWSTQFVIGIQYMVIAGAVAKWYWSKNKTNLNSPISTSAQVAFKFHLGSIAFGSFVITVIAIIRAILTSLTKNKAVKAIVDACIGALESFLKFLSKNAYILIAMHGEPFYKSGKRAAKIIFQNAVNIASINYVGDFILGMAQLLIVLISLLITLGIMTGTDSEYSFIVYLIVFFVSLFIAVTCFSIFETTIDTIFLCFCEDSLLNDGMSRPYAMSRDLMEFVENSKKLYGEKK